MQQKPGRRSASRPAGPPAALVDSAAPDPAAAPPPADGAPVGAAADSATRPNDPRPATGPEAHSGSPDDAPHRETAAEVSARRRVRAPRDQPAARTAVQPVADDLVDLGPPAAHSDVQPTRPRRDRGFRESADDRSLRALVSLRGTQLPTDLAVRAREFANPTPADLAEAEAEMVLVRRHYVPTTPLATGNRRRPDEGKAAGSGDAAARPNRTRDRRR